MKNFIATLLIMALPIVGFSQSKLPNRTDVSSLYSKYVGQQGFVTIEISKEMLTLIGNMKLNGNEDLMKVVEGINNIKLIVSDQPRESFVSDMEQIAVNPSFRFMTSVNDSGQNTRFFYKNDEKGEVSEFVMLSFGKKDNVIISINGKIDLKKISSLSGLNIGGLGGLDKAAKNCED